MGIDNGSRWVLNFSGSHWLLFLEVIMSKHKHPQYNLRLPQDLKFFLAEQAKKDGRSLNNFIVKTLEETRCKLLTQIN